MYQSQSNQANQQIQLMLQQMQQSEQQNATQLRQLANQIHDISSHETQATRQIQQLQSLCNQLIQENNRLSNMVSTQQAQMSTFGYQQNPTQGQFTGTPTQYGNQYGNRNQQYTGNQGFKQYQ